MENFRRCVLLYINGQRHEINAKNAFISLAQYLRYRQKLCGTKIVCAEGDCGACTVLVSSLGHSTKINPDFVPINACIVPLAQLDCCHVLTVEALKDDGQLSVVQKAIVKAYASQCGFCTPGFAMAITALHRQHPHSLTPQRVKNGLTGNLCRCTGYQNLIEAALSIDPTQLPDLQEKYETKQIHKERAEAWRIPIKMAGLSLQFEAPTALSECDQWLKDQTEGRILAGGTDLGVAQNKGRTFGPSVLSLHLIPELYLIERCGDLVKVGARVTIERLRQYCKDAIPTFASFLNLFASPQIKNIATFVGNVANASPIADTLPFLMVSEGRAHVRSFRGTREIALTDLYYGYKTMSLEPGEYFTHICFRIPHPTDFLGLEKVSQRKDLDISTINCAFFFRLERNTSAVLETRIALGGVGPTVMRAHRVEAMLNGQRLTPLHIDKASILLQQEITPINDLRGSATFRRALVQNLFQRFCHKVMENSCETP